LVYIHTHTHTHTHTYGTCLYTGMTGFTMLRNGESKRILFVILFVPQNNIRRTSNRGIHATHL